MKIYYFIINLPIALAIKSAIKMRDSSDINNAMKNQYLLKKVPYSELLNKIDHHEISKVYFSPKYDKVISENVEETMDIYTDFTFTDIIPTVSTNLIETSIKNNVEPVFIKIQDPSPIQIIATDLLNGINNFFVPFIFLSLLISF